MHKISFILSFVHLTLPHQFDLYLQSMTIKLSIPLLQGLFKLLSSCIKLLITNIIMMTLIFLAYIESGLINHPKMHEHSIWLQMH